MELTTQSIWNKIFAGGSSGVFIVAEAGKNFIETEAEQPVAVYLDNAKRLARAAKAAGADAIKFQTHTVEDEVLNIPFVSPHFSDKKRGERHAWVKRNTEATPVKEFWMPLKRYCEEIGIVFFSTPMSRGAARRLHEVGVPVWKVGSGDILDFPLLEFLVSTGKPIFISSGMSTLEEIDAAIGYLKSCGARFGLMHALSKYPGVPEEANLATIDFYRERYPGTPIGFSENSIAGEPSVMASALGAVMIEKHFSLDRGFWGPDHKVCSTPIEFKKMVDSIRALESDTGKKRYWLERPGFEAIYGEKSKMLRPGEEGFRPLFRKALFAACDIPAGAVINAEMVCAMRPQFAGHIPSERYHDVVGKRAERPLKKHGPLKTSDLT